MAKRTSGGTGSFTYDFGILISQATVSRLTRTVQSTLTLAGAYYALNKQATEYIATLRKQQIFFGGQVATMKAIADAQDRIIQGTSRFDVNDQLEGMNNLMRVGIDARKEFEWTEKAAHAMGVSYSQFSNAIANGIRGNMSGLVDMGLITERATRMFEKYQGNTVMRQQAILNFVKQHKALQTAIKQDFGTIQDEMRRLTSVWKSFLQAILGQPNDPGSFYGQVRSALKEVADGFARNTVIIRRYAFQIGQVLGWVIRQIGHLVTWLGRQVKSVLQMIWKVGEDYQERVRSVLVWLEFWKVAIVGFFKEYGKTLLKATLITMGVIWAVKGLALQMRYLEMMGPVIGRSFGGWLQSLAVFLPRTFRRIWVSIGRMFAGNVSSPVIKFFTATLPQVLIRVVGWLSGLIRLIGSLFTASNPVGWIILAVAALTLLYKKCEGFRNYVNNLFQSIVQFVRLVYNSFIWLYVQLRVIGIKISNWWKNTVGGVKGFLSWLKQDLGVFTGTIKRLWDTIMDTRLGKYIQGIIDMVTAFYRVTLKPIFDGAGKLVSTLKGWFSRSADTVAKSAVETAQEYGFNAPVWNNPFTPSTTTETPTEASTAILPSVGTPALATAGDNATTMNFNQGAIQIMLNGSSGIDENILAQKIKEVILDLDRQGRMRGGRA